MVGRYKCAFLVILQFLLHGVGTRIILPKKYSRIGAASTALFVD
jgi:hypothetical protein